MIRVEIDKGAYEPKKEVKYPYVGKHPNSGTVMLILDPHTGVKLVKGVGATAGSAAVGTVLTTVPTFEYEPLAEGESLTITNAWEIANG